MYYKSPYYSSDYYSSDYYNNSAGVVLTSPTYYGKLGELGFTGVLADRQFQFICTFGGPDVMNDCMLKHLRSLGFTGGVQEMVAQKSRSEGFSSPSQMWIVQGLIPL